MISCNYANKFGLPVDPGNESVDLPAVNTTINMSSPPSSFSSGKEIKVVAPINGVYQSAFADFNGEFYYAYMLLESSCKHPLQKHQNRAMRSITFRRFRELLEKIEVNYFECTTRLKSVLNHIRHALHA